MLKEFTPKEFTAIMLFGLMLGFMGSALTGCGSADCAADGTCDPGGGESDAGTGDKDAGTTDSGSTDTDAQTGTDAGKDTGTTDPCKGYEWINGTFNCCIATCADNECHAEVQDGVCHVVCVDLFDSSVDLLQIDPDKKKLTLDQGGGIVDICTQK